MVFLEDAWGINLEYHQVHRLSSISMNLLIYVCHKALRFARGCLLQMRAELRLRLLLMVFVTQSWEGNCFSKQSAITLTFSFGWYFIPEGPWIAAGAFGPSLFISDFSIGHRLYVWTHSSFLLFATLRVPFYGSLMGLATQFSTILHAGSRVACHSSLNLILWFSRLSRPGWSLFRSESVILLTGASVGLSVKYCWPLNSTLIPGFSLLEIHE
jgi:hypothetical protein